MSKQTMEKVGLSNETYHKQVPFGRTLGAKQVDIDSRTFEGFSAGIGNRDQGDDIIMPGAFKKSINERVSSGKVKLLDQHSPRTTKNVWGKAVEAEERELSTEQRRNIANELGKDDIDEAPSHLLWSRFLVSNKRDAMEALRDVRDEILDGLSIGFRTVRVEFIADEDVNLSEQGIDAEIAWLRGDGVRKIHELAWWETSLVVWPMNQAASPIPSTVMTTLSKVADLGEAAEEEISEKKVRYAIRALEDLVGGPEEQVRPNLDVDELEGLSDDLQRAIEQLEREDSVPEDARKDITALYEEFREKRESASRADFMIHVGEVLSENKAQHQRLSEARTPEWDGTETQEEQAWGDVDLSLEAFVQGAIEHGGFELDEDDPDAVVVEDLPEEMKSWIATRTLIGNAEADNSNDLIAFPVVNPATNNLNEAGLDAANNRAPQADISESTVESIQSASESLLEEHFDRDIDDNEEDSAEAPEETSENEESDMSEASDEEVIEELKETLDDLVEALDGAGDSEDIDEKEEDSDSSTPAELEEEEKSSDPTPEEQDEEVAGDAGTSDEDEPDEGKSEEEEEGRSDEHFESKRAAERGLASLAEMDLDS